MQLFGGNSEVYFKNLIEKLRSKLFEFPPRVVRILVIFQYVVVDIILYSKSLGSTQTGTYYITRVIRSIASPLRFCSFVHFALKQQSAISCVGPSLRDTSITAAKTVRLLERHYKSDTQKYSFSIRPVDLWNNLDAEIRSTDSHQLFKRSVKDQKPVYFDQFLTEITIRKKFQGGFVSRTFRALYHPLYQTQLIKWAMLIVTIQAN